VVSGLKRAELALREGVDAPWVLKRKWEELEPIATSTPQAGPSVLQAGPYPSSGSKVVEEAPDWTYPVRGSYKIAKAFAIFDVKAEDITLEVKLSNNNSHKVKRQLLATVRFGDTIKGVMRFCPMNKPQPRSVKDFEAACMLEDGVWPGPGQQEWFMRWRGEEADEDNPDEWETRKYDDSQQEVTFEVGEDGKINLFVIMVPSGGGVVGHF
jgi:hypothetical protein